MIEKRTVFVLGAGASKPYGFPLGFELHTALCSGETYTDDLLGVFEACDIDRAEVMRFRTTLLRSSLPSVDAFLARRTEYERIGKIAIASQIIPRESVDQTLRAGNPDHWFGWLWNKMTVDALEPNDVFANDVRFITFNYDRSLEALLFHAFRNTYGFADAAANAAVARFPILHVYGSADGHPRGQYRPDFNHNTLQAAARGIRVIEEARQDDQRFSEARRMIAAAEVVCFLGFGFDPLNLRRLSLPEIFAQAAREARQTRVLASVYEMTKAEVHAALFSVCPDTGWEALDLPNRQFLRNVDWLR